MRLHCPKWRRQGLILFAFILLSTLTPGLAEESPPLTNPLHGCKYLAQLVKERFPAICGHRVHWFIGVDISGSMDPQPLDTVKAILSSWLNHVVVDDDRVTLVTFDYECRVFPQTAQNFWEAGPSAARGALVQQMTAPLQNRKQKGSEVLQARMLLLDLAQKADSTAYLPIVIVFTDRSTTQRGASPNSEKRALPSSEPSKAPAPIDVHDSTTSQPEARHNAEAKSKFGSTFASRQDAAPDDPVEDLVQLNYPDFKNLPLVIISGAKKTEDREKTTHRRSTPLLATPQAAPRPVDNDDGPSLSVMLAIAPWIALLASVGALLRLRAIPAGWLFNEQTKIKASVYWSLKPRPLDIKATYNAVSISLIPKRADLNDPIVAQASLQDFFKWSHWSVRLTSLSGMTFRDAGSRVQELDLIPGQTQAVDVVDARGEVAQGHLKWTPSKGALNCWRWALVCAGLFLLLISVQGPLRRATAPSPPPAVATPAVPMGDPLCY